MTISGIKEVALNVATGVMTILALAVGGMRIKEHFDASRDPLEPIHISSWQDYRNGGHRIGPATAKVTVVEFADFQCPFCAAAAKDLSVLRKRYPQIATIYRHYPLPIHPFAAPAAVAAVCASRAGRFERFHDLLFAQRDSIGKRSWVAWAREAGVDDTTSFGRCLTDSLAVAQVETDKEAGNKLGVAGTPVLLVNDMEIRGYPGRERLERQIKAALK